ncbi:hypothetical protein [Spirochaeta isovalerica]|uniref:Uncharacterized protein n=1 Tax=Spirochaeta isovalerica TaxID=150 RepID=A0A841RC50_9SPIO|nr:hypothetical protein [Spirochaeta isovalerica]MBB6481523.1 hypothetical protein [Spirochaeta isovalerica]
MIFDFTNYIKDLTFQLENHYQKKLKLSHKELVHFFHQYIIDETDPISLKDKIKKINYNNINSEFPYIIGKISYWREKAISKNIFHPRDDVQPSNRRRKKRIIDYLNDELRYSYNLSGFLSDYASKTHYRVESDILYGGKLTIPSILEYNYSNNRNTCVGKEFTFPGLRDLRVIKDQEAFPSYFIKNTRLLEVVIDKYFKKVKTEPVVELLSYLNKNTKSKIIIRLSKENFSETVYFDLINRLSSSFIFKTTDQNSFIDVFYCFNENEILKLEELISLSS